MEEPVYLVLEYLNQRHLPFDLVLVVTVWRVFERFSSLLGAGAVRVVFGTILESQVAGSKPLVLALFQNFPSGE